MWLKICWAVRKTEKVGSFICEDKTLQDNWYTCWVLLENARGLLECIGDY